MKKVRDEIKGWLLVTVQFGLFSGIILTPAGEDWRWPSYLRDLSWLMFALAGLALWQLGKARTANPVPTLNGELVVTGLYRKVRHPIYGLLIVGFALLSLGSQNLQAIFLWIALVSLFYFKSNFEEKLLVHRYPEYREYQNRTGRFFPKI